MILLSAEIAGDITPNLSLSLLEVAQCWGKIVTSWWGVRVLEGQGDPVSSEEGFWQHSETWSNEVELWVNAFGVEWTWRGSSVDGLGFKLLLKRMSWAWWHEPVMPAQKEVKARGFGVSG